MKHKTKRQYLQAAKFKLEYAEFLIEKYGIREAAEHVQLLIRFAKVDIFEARRT